MLHTASRGCSRSWLRRLTALIAVSALAFVALPNVAVAADPMEYLDVSFGGTFAEDTYTTGGDEVARGSVTKHGSMPTKLDGGGITLAGGTNGVTFTSTASFSASGKVNKGFRAEMEYRTKQTPSNLATLFSAMGNIFVRANGSNLEYGFSTNPSGSTWNDYTKSVTLPSNNVKHIIQLTYLPGADGAASTLQLKVDGVAGETATSAAGELAAVSDSVGNKFGIGYEVNPASGAASRGLAGDVFRARVADSDAPWEILDASQLLHVNFNGTFSGTSYT
ncbi:alpha-L-fucosidase, partial [Bifidobacterium bifidum]|nr:alpha-L-fucosidase [Bifidobacterium bifidum]